MGAAIAVGLAIWAMLGLAVAPLIGRWLRWCARWRE